MAAQGVGNFKDTVYQDINTSLNLYTKWQGKSQ